MSVPHISTEVMDYLLRIYPDKSPSIDTPDRQIWVKLGEIQVVRHLKSLYDSQQDNLLGEKQ